MAANNKQGKLTFSCEINSLRNNNRNNEEVKEHENMQDKKIFICQLCPFTSKRKENLKRHEKEIHGNNLILFPCDYCSYTSKRRYDVKRHEKVLHGNEIILFLCEYCNFTSKWKHHIKRHERMQHGNEIILFSCELCPFTSKWKGDVKRHEKGKHGEELRRENTVKIVFKLENSENEKCIKKEDSNYQLNWVQGDTNNHLNMKHIDFERKRAIGREAKDYIEKYGLNVERMPEDWKKAVEFENRIEKLEKRMRGNGETMIGFKH